MIKNIHVTFYVYAYIDKRETINNILNPNYNKIIYIGQTCDDIHLRWIKRNSYIGDLFYQWTNKYGNNCIEIILLYTIIANNNIDNERLSKDIETYFIQDALKNKLPILNNQKINFSIHTKNNNKNQHIKKPVICITTNEVFTSLSAACEKYKLNLTTFKKRIKLQLNIGIDNHFNPLFWKFVDFNENNNITQLPIYYIYMLYNKFTNQLIYIGITKNIHRRLLNHLNSLYNNWIIDLYNIKYDYPLQCKIIYKSTNYKLICLKEAELIYNYSKNTILFNKHYNNQYYTQLRNYIKTEFNILFRDTTEQEISNMLFNDRKNIHLPSHKCDILPFDIKNIPDIKSVNNDKINKIAIIYEDNIPCAVICRQFNKLQINHLCQWMDTLYLKNHLRQKGKEYFYIQEIKTFPLNQTKEAINYRNDIAKKLSLLYTLYQNDNINIDKINGFKTYVQDELFIRNYTYTKLIATKTQRPNSKKIKCSTTNTVFLTQNDAAYAANTMPINIQRAIKNKRSCGKLADNTALFWEYTD